ncbi:MAG TPA: ATP synthase F1 subunit delta [Pirellulales bacterium]|jgi:F-type H+-transporting ATPase subunit delta|nr:ATP synthase F1 subunit delta [Pirellulales bacterium]
MSDFDEEQFSSAIQSAEIDPAAHQLATTYARALLGASENAGNTEEVLAEFDSLLRDVLSRYPRIDDILASGMIANEEKAELVARVFSGRVTPLFLHFLEVVTGHGRGRYLKAIHSAAHDLYDQLRGRVRVQVTTAVPLDEELAQRIAAQLRSALSAEPKLERRVDPELVSGIVLRIGDTVYDGSVSTQLERIRSQMIHRSVHEIQRRRDSFGTPAGN